MSTFTQGILVFVVFTAIVSSAMVFTLLKARAEEPKRRNFLPKLLPFIIADALFVLIFIFWVFSQNL